MRIDDRLATVLRQRAAGERAARTQYRQLLDLLDERLDAVLDDVEESGWERLSSLSAQIAPADRAAILREDGWRLRNPALIMFLAEQESEVAAAALGSVKLASDDWALLIPELPLRARGFLRLRRDLPQVALDVLERLGVRDRGLPRPREERAPEPDDRTSDEAASADAHGNAPGRWAVSPEAEDGPAPYEVRRPIQTEPAPEAVEEQLQSAATESPIAALVARIDAFQKKRQRAPDRPSPANGGAMEQRDMPPLPEEAEPEFEEEAFATRRKPSLLPLQSIDFFTDAEFVIDWAEQDIAPMIVGTPLRELAQDAAPEIAGVFETALVCQQPLRHIAVELRGAPAISGDWIIDATPRFSELSGHFEGYLGRFRRPLEADTPAPTAAELAADEMRELLHELRTPANAIQGFAEMIQQQISGPVPHAYRALAAGINGDVARLLAGFDDMERLARLEGGEDYLEEGSCELDGILAATVRQFRTVLQPRRAGFDLIVRAAQTTVPLARRNAELLLWRLFAGITAATQAGETLEVSLHAEAARLVLTCDLPALLERTTDWYSPDLRLPDTEIDFGLLGPGFALRLALVEARAAGGTLRRRDKKVVLTLPLVSDT